MDFGSPPLYKVYLKLGLTHLKYSKRKEKEMGRGKDTCEKCEVEKREKH